MNPPPEEALFHLALAKPAPERAGFLDGACHGDAALRQRLEALLAAHEQPTTYAADMNLVQRALELNDLGHARRLLDRHRPIDPDQEDIRGWEWHYLWKQDQSRLDYQRDIRDCRFVLVGNVRQFDLGYASSIVGAQLSGDIHRQLASVSPADLVVAQPVATSLGSRVCADFKCPETIAATSIISSQSR